MKKAAAVLSAFLVVATLTAFAEGTRVRFDEAHDNINTISEDRASDINRSHPEWYFFGAMAETLEQNGYAVERGLSAFDSGLLAGVDIVIVSTPRSVLSEEELASLLAYVEAGGGLMVVQDSNPPSDSGSNQIAELFGAGFRPGVLRSRQGDWDPESFRVDAVPSSHLIVLGIDGFQINWGCSIEATEDWDVLLQSSAGTWQDSNGNRSQDAGEPSGPLSIAQARQVGRGRVVLVGDNSFHDGVWLSNKPFFMNCLSWLAGINANTAAEDIPAFGVDPDIVRDCVVSTNGSPQELSASMQFFPNSQRVRPGEITYWTLELGGLEGPFTIVPEMDNDGTREPAIFSEDPRVVFAHTYDTPNLYVPYVQVVDRHGQQHEIHTRSVIGVIPEVMQRSGIGLNLPSLDGEPGDYLKAMNVYAFDYRLFGDASGEQFIQQELDRVAGLGVNMMIYNIAWTFDQRSDFLHEPVYGDAGWLEACCHWISTLPVDALVKLSDWCHERGMRVAIRYFIFRKCYDSVDRESYDPSSAALYMEQQRAIKTIYAELCQTLGIEAFFLDAENDAFTREPRVRQLIQDIREVYDGVLAGGAYSVDHIYACPFADELDLLAWSDYYFFTHGVSEDAATEQFRDAFLFHYSEDISPVLSLFQKPGMVLETGVNIRETPSDSVERQYRGYLEAFRSLQSAGVPLIGSGWWVWNLSNPPIEPHVMRGHSAETILDEYFGTILSDSHSVRISASGGDAPSIDRMLRDFESGLPRYLISSQGSSIAPTIASNSMLGGHCLRVDLVPTAQVEYRHGFIVEEHRPALNWSGFSSLNFLLKSSNENWGLEITLYDADGDRFNTRINTKPFLAEVLPASGGWRLVSIPLEIFARPSWHTGGNGVMDWRQVTNWGVGLFYKDQGAQVLWFDNFYLSTEGGLP